MEAHTYKTHADKWNRRLGHISWGIKELKSSIGTHILNAYLAKIDKDWKWNQDKEQWQEHESWKSQHTCKWEYTSDAYVLHCWKPALNSTAMLTGNALVTNEGG